jgi:hypothetical protein
LKINIIFINGECVISVEAVRPMISKKFEWICKILFLVSVFLVGVMFLFPEIMPLDMSELMSLELSHWQDYSFTNVYFYIQWFNVIEALTWFSIAFLIVKRFKSQGQSAFEILYAVCFLIFGLTDCFEAWSFHNWLILFKWFNLLAVLYFRSLVLRKWYQNSKVY